MNRVVLDTNIIVSALLQPVGPPAQVFLLALGGTVPMCVSGDIFAEYEEVITELFTPRHFLEIVAASAQ